MIDLILVRVVPYSVLGALLGVAYFSALGWNVRLYVEHRTGLSALFVHLIRLLVIGTAFTLCARQGASALLSSLLGFQMSRPAAVNQQRHALEKNS